MMGNGAQLLLMEELQIFGAHVILRHSETKTLSQQHFIVIQLT
jgi:hypothetical protein